MRDEIQPHATEWLERLLSDGNINTENFAPVLKTCSNVTIDLLHKLYLQVSYHGGFTLVNKNRRWKKLEENFKTRDGEIVMIKEIYSLWLKPLEKSKTIKNKNLEIFDPTKSRLRSKKLEE